MIRDDNHWLSTTDRFYAAAIGEQTWYSALEGLAEATGSRYGELIGLGANAGIPFHVMTGVDPAFLCEFADIGGGDPAVNPRVRAGAAAPIMQVLTEADFMTTDEYKRDEHIREVEHRWGVAYICLTTLERRSGLLAGLAVGRTKAQGHITADDRACFSSLAPHVRAAVRTQMALDGQGATLVAGAMEALSIPAFVCNALGRVQALTPSAEKLVSDGSGLYLRQGELRTTDIGETTKLADAIAKAAAGLVAPGAPKHSTIVVRGKGPDQRPLVLDVIALPRRVQYEFSFSPYALVVIRGAACDSAEARRSALLQGAYGLTASEADVALRLSFGRTAETIATNRGVSLETVRTQIKSIRAKLGVDSQIELVARLNLL